MRITRAIILSALLAAPAAAIQERVETLEVPVMPEQLVLPFSAVPGFSSGVSEVIPEKPKASTPAGAPLMGVSMPSVSKAAPSAAQSALAQKQPEASNPQNPVSGEQEKRDSGTLFENGAQAPSADVAPVFALVSAGSGSHGLRLIPGTLRQKLTERFHFRRLWLQNLYWYSVIHISGGRNPSRGLWSKFHSKLIVAQADGATLPVSSHRRFFSYMRVMGQTGRFYVLGFAPRDDKGVIEEARQTFKKYFDVLEVGPQEEAAFERFLGRVQRYNQARRNQTNLRKHIRDTMLKASIMPVDKLSGFLDGLFRGDLREKTDDFQQNGGQKKVLEAFRQAILQTIAEEDPAAKDRVVGAVLLGSFASGGATANSDFDVELLTANGGSSRVKAFEKRMTVRWREAGLHKTNPVTFKDYPDPASRAVIDRIHYFDYLVISPFPDLVNALERKPGEPPAFTADARMSRWSPLLRKIEYFSVYWTTIWTDLRALFA